MLLKRVVSLTGVLCLFLVATSLPGPACASEANQAGLVVQFGDGRVEARCVTFEEDEILGADLLARSGLEVVVDVSSGMGVTVCRIEGEGCDYPVDACFCQCGGGGECAYWNYFYRDPGDAQWTYSPLGAGLRKVRPGSVEAWAWGDGNTPPSDEWTFEAVCRPATPTPTDTAEPPMPTSTAKPLTPTDAAEPPTPVPATAIVAPAETWTPAPSPTVLVSPTPASAPGTGPSLASYWPFGLMVLGLAIAGWIVWQRRA